MLHVGTTQESNIPREPWKSGQPRQHEGVNSSPDSIEGGQDLLMEDGNEKFKKQSSVCMGEKDHGDPSVFLLTVAVHFTPQLARIVQL